MDFASLSLAMIAGIALFRYQRSVMEVIIGGGLMGLLMRYLLQ